MGNNVINDTATQTILDRFHPLIKQWFLSRYARLSDAQRQALPPLQTGANVLVSAPTGAGKTLTAFLSVIDTLLVKGFDDELEDMIHCVYISPLKALANDIQRNLHEPLAELKDLAEAEGMPFPKIRVGVRSGDTSQYEKQKMVRKPPHILITTPETLSISIATTKFSQRFTDVRVVIVDEIHELCASKRGVQLNLAVEILAHLVGGTGPLQRIGLSATQAPIETLARFLAGRDRSGDWRPMEIVEITDEGRLELELITPAALDEVAYEASLNQLFPLLHSLVRDHSTTLIFTNTRSTTEKVLRRLQSEGIKSIAAHHGSLSKHHREDVEASLKDGEIRAVVTSTSLELGIDIGYIDLVCQIGNPKTVARMIQRIGRAGHSLHEESKGRMIVVDIGDLVEGTVTVASARAGLIDRIAIPDQPLDVLAQMVIAMSLIQFWTVDEALELIRSAYCYRDLSRSDLVAVLELLAGDAKLEAINIYPKIWYDEESERFGIRRGTRMIYFQNTGTIPQSASYRVYLSERNIELGTLSGPFVERLTKRDVFILGGSTYRLQRIQGLNLYVEPAHGRKPTIPSWTGEQLHRSYDLSRTIGSFLRAATAQLAPDAHSSDTTNREALQRWLELEYGLDVEVASTIQHHLVGQYYALGDILPSDRVIAIEGYKDRRGRYHLIFHALFGRSVNEVLARVVADAIAKKMRWPIRFHTTDDGFALVLDRSYPLDDSETIRALFEPTRLHERVRADLEGSELYRQRFRHVATRALLILRRYRGHDISLKKQQYRAERLLELIRNQSRDQSPIRRETYREILEDTFDLPHAREILEGVVAGEIAVHSAGYRKQPSPFARQLLTLDPADILAIRDRAVLASEFDSETLARILSAGSISAVSFEPALIESYFCEKRPAATTSRAFYRAVRDLMLVRWDGFERVDARDRNDTAAPHTPTDCEARGDHERWPLSVTSITANEVPPQKRNQWCIDGLERGSLTTVHIDRPYLVAPAARITLLAVYGEQDELDEPERAAINALRGEENRESDGSALTRAVVAALEAKNRIRRRHHAPTFDEPSHWIVESGTRTRTGGRDAEGAATIPYDEAVETLLSAMLSYRGPTTQTAAETALMLEPSLVEAALRDLADANRVVSGHFTSTETIEYLLTRDLLKLELARAGETNVYDREYVARYLLAKEFTGYSTVEDYFEQFGAVTMLRSVLARVDQFDIHRWVQRLQSGAILKGRFINGRVGYIQAERAPMYIALYRRAELRPIDRDVREYIATRPGATLVEVRAQFSESYAKDDINDSLKLLDRNLYICRHPDIDTEHGTTRRNRYRVLEVEPMPIKEATRAIIRQYLRAHGPCPIREVRNAVGLTHETVDSMLKQLVDEDEAARIVTVGQQPIEMYLLEDELDQLSDFTIERTVLRILPYYDPYCDTIRNRLLARFGDGWYSPVIYGDAVVGAIFHRRAGSYLDVEDLQIEAAQIDPFLAEIDRFMRYYRMLNIDIIRIARLNGQPVAKTRLEILAPFLEAGFVIVDGQLVQGEIYPTSYAPSELLNLVLYAQHIIPERRFDDPITAFKRHGGFRNAQEISLRVNTKMYALKDFARNHDLRKAKLIPSYLTFCRAAELPIYKAAKNKPITDEMRAVLALVRFGEQYTSKQLKERAPLAKSKFRSVLNQCFDGLYLTRNSMNRILRVPDLEGLSQYDARVLVLKRLLRTFGVVSLTQLSKITKYEYKRRELRRLLSEFEDQGLISRGFFRRGEDQLYFIVNEFIPVIGEYEMNERWVLCPQDQLFRYLEDEVRERFDLTGCYVIFAETRMVGAFHGKTKREQFILDTMIGGEREKRTMRRYIAKQNWTLIETDVEYGPAPNMTGGTMIGS